MTQNQTKLSFVPPLFPNQTLYSWASVFHEMSGNATVKESRLQLFELVRKGLHFHIPSHLDALCASTQLVLGSAETIVKNATTIPYYTKFRQPNVAIRSLKLVRSKSSLGVAQSLGMTTNASFTHPPRRSCHECIQADKAEFELSYWHRDHQLPGVLVCPQHGTTLLSLPYEHDAIDSETLLWPEDDWKLTDVSARRQYSSDMAFSLHRLAQLATDMAKGELTDGYSIHKMRNACLPMLQERNLIAPDGSLMTIQAMRDYEKHFSNIATVTGVTAAAQGTIRPLINAIQLLDRRTHPLEWMMVIEWLFGNWDTFEEKYRIAAKTEGGLYSSGNFQYSQNLPISHLK